MLTSRSETWRDLIEVKTLLREIADRYDIENHDEEASLWMDERSQKGKENQQSDASEERNIFEEIDMELVEKLIAENLIGDSMKEKEPEQTVEVTLDLEQSTFIGLSLHAHRHNIKLNDLIVKILTEYIEQKEKSNSDLDQEKTK